MKYKIILAAAAFLGVAAFAQQDDAPKIQDLEGKPAPEFKMVDAAGKEYTNKSLKGQVVLIDFWATWCGPCKAASPTIQSLHEKYGKKGLMVLGANAFEKGKKDAAAGYSKEHGYTYQMTVNNDALAKSWGVKGIPTFIIIDKTGVVKKVQVGFGGEETAKALEDAVVQALSG